MSITLHRDSGLLAVICDDLVVRIIDIETRRIVRELAGFRGRVLDVVRTVLLFSVTCLPFVPTDVLARLQMACNSVYGFSHPHI